MRAKQQSAGGSWDKRGKEKERRKEEETVDWDQDGTFAELMADGGARERLFFILC